VDDATNEYFSDNATVTAGEEAQHVAKILKDKNWTKGNPTPSDLQLAEKLVRLFMHYKFVLN
jgi:hypothetical protein